MDVQISVEDTVGRVVRHVGGSLVSDLLPAGVDLPKNADFVFQQYGVVAELKRLEKDQSEDREMAAKIQQLYQNWIVRRKAVPVGYGRFKLNVRNLPPDCANEIISLYREPIARRIRTANRQIKSSKRTLEMEDAIGLLLLAQDGDYSIGPEAVLNLASRCLKGGQFRGIDDIIHFNANVPATRPGDPLGYTFWTHACRDKRRTIPSELIQSLSDAWHAELERAAGRPIPIVVLDKPIEFLDALQFPKARR